MAEFKCGKCGKTTEYQKDEWETINDTFTRDCDGTIVLYRRVILLYYTGE